MRKFLVLTYGFVPPTEEVQKAWGAWFSSVGPRLVDPGNQRPRNYERPELSSIHEMSGSRPPPSHHLLSVDSADP